MEEYLPDIYQKSIYTIDYSKLYNRGIKCLLFDLDNTIVPPYSTELSQKAKDLFISLNAVFDVVQYSFWRAKTNTFQAIYYLIQYCYYLCFYHHHRFLAPRGSLLVCMLPETGP